METIPSQEQSTDLTKAVGVVRVDVASPQVLCGVLGTSM